MTSEELAALKVGDELLIRVAVDSVVCLDKHDFVIVSRPGRLPFNVPISAIHSLAPPKPLAVGDWTQYGEILAISGTSAWCKHRKHPDAVPCTAYLHRLILTTAPESS